MPANTLVVPAATESRGRAADWAAAASEHVARLGFTLVNADRPGTGGSHLVVALRATPTLRHFDPEVIAYYAPAEGRAAVAIVDRSIALAEPVRRVLWGHVHVIDRLGVENRFLTFGGLLRSAAVERDDVVLDLVSPGPIVRWGGHSQGTDAIAAEIGAFFGRLIVPVDLRPGAEARIDSVAPEVLYAAFLVDLSGRLGAAQRRGHAIDGELETWLVSERQRVRAEPATWSAGDAILAELDLKR